MHAECRKHENARRSCVPRRRGGKTVRKKTMQLAAQTAGEDDVCKGLEELLGGFYREFYSVEKGQKTKLFSLALV